eukprot:TRINITY_DN89433_c0_g1_i1.p1 TRINITY_DN89433_c0_g1~~TRINITY_DN89433_c0_g1_i1.p1  ORF type:complete len:221 (-),score=15.22 TRINITY_DN89433_c0_g1_i1:9-671(-)
MQSWALAATSAIIPPDSSTWKSHELPTGRIKSERLAACLRSLQNISCSFVLTPYEGRHDEILRTMRRCWRKRSRAYWLRRMSRPPGDWHLTCLPEPCDQDITRTWLLPALEMPSEAYMAGGKVEVAQTFRVTICRPRRILFGQRVVIARSRGPMQVQGPLGQAGIGKVYEVPIQSPSLTNQSHLHTAAYMFEEQRLSSLLAPCAKTSIARGLSAAGTTKP